ncbi:hypothetical protein J521_0816 [Acinetobacter baumannii 1035119]|nr:hypothetical protein J521_0816 [Acinetobacter baumannii 1035119]
MTSNKSFDLKLRHSLVSTTTSPIKKSSELSSAGRSDKLLMF